MQGILGLEQSIVVQGSFEKLGDDGEDEVNEKEAGRGEGLGEAESVVHGGHDFGVIGRVEVRGERKGMAVEEVDVESVSGGVEAAVGDDAGGEEREDEQGRDEAERHGFLEILPGDRQVVVEADVGDEAVRQLD